MKMDMYIKLILIKEQWKKFLTPLIPAAREFISKRRLEQKQLQEDNNLFVLTYFYTHASLL